MPSATDLGRPARSGWWSRTMTDLAIDGTVPVDEPQLADV